MPRHAEPRGQRRGIGLAGVLTAALLLAACSSSTGSSGAAPSSGAGAYPGWPGSGTVVANTDFIPEVFNSELAVGDNRVMVLPTNQAGTPLASPDMTMDMAFYDLAASVDTPVDEETGTFRWLIPDAKGIFTAPTTFSHAGDWGVEVTAHQDGEADATARVLFSVRETTNTPAIGADAVPSDTVTVTDPAGLPAITTDPDPDPSFYTLSIRDAIAAGKPFVIVFATPAFCTSGVCGPALDQVRSISGDYTGRVNFIHVEPYLLELVNGQTQPKVSATGQPQTIQAVAEWGLPTEPYIVVVDANGKVANKFEGMAYPDELTAALDALLP